jgi:hypothetical protein
MAPVTRRWRVLAPAAVLVSLAALALAAPGATSRPAEEGDDAAADVAQASGVILLEAEIDDMRAAGVPEDDPKLAMLRSELAALEDDLRTEPVPEPGVDMSPEAATRAADVDAGAEADTSLWDDGAVPCEPIPPDLLTAEEIAGATCRSEPRPDGSALYVATTPSGTDLVVEFHPDGSATRLP